MDSTVPMADANGSGSLALLRDAMSIAGPAAQTLAALRNLACKDERGETFAMVKTIADEACRNPRTVERDLRKLVALGCVDYLGRGRRRSVTYRVSPRALNFDQELKYGILPRWAAKLLATWAERAVFACVFSRHRLFESVWDAPETLMDCRSDYSVAELQQHTGLSPQSIVTAKRKLGERGIIFVEGGVSRSNGSWGASHLYLNLDFEVPAPLIAPREKRSGSQGAKLPSLQQDAASPDESLLQNLSVGSSNSVVPTSPSLSGSLSKSVVCIYGEPLREHFTGKVTTVTPPPTAFGVAAEAAELFEEEELARLRVYAAAQLRRVVGAIDFQGALTAAIKRGCKTEQMRARLDWFIDHQGDWEPDLLPAVLDLGIRCAAPDLKADAGWYAEQSKPDFEEARLKVSQSA